MTLEVNEYPDWFQNWRAAVFFLDKNTLQRGQTIFHLQFNLYMLKVYIIKEFDEIHVEHQPNLSVIGQMLLKCEICYYITFITHTIPLEKKNSDHLWSSQ